MTKDEALKLALEALLKKMSCDDDCKCSGQQAITAIKEALAQPEQEPYCWTWDEWISGGKWRAEYGWEKPERQVTNLQPLYTTSPQRKPLTDEEIYSVLENLQIMYNRPPTTDSRIIFARAIEAAHGIKGEV